MGLVNTSSAFGKMNRCGKWEVRLVSKEGLKVFESCGLQLSQLPRPLAESDVQHELSLVFSGKGSLGLSGLPLPSFCCQAYLHLQAEACNWLGLGFLCSVTFSDVPAVPS